MILADFRFRPFQRRAAANLARVICPPDAEPLGLVETIVDHFETSLRVMPPLIRGGLLAGLLAFDHGAIAFHGRPFRALPVEKARAYFERWWHGALTHRFVYGVRALIAFAYYEQPVVRDRLAYHPDAWIAAAARRRLERYGADIRRHEEELLARDPLVKAETLTRKVKQVEHA